MHHILQVLTEKHVIVEMMEPYIPGFLAFREVNHLLECIKQLDTPDSVPQVSVVQLLFSAIIWCGKFLMDQMIE